MDVKHQSYDQANKLFKTIRLAILGFVLFLVLIFYFFPKSISTLFSEYIREPLTVWAQEHGFYYSITDRALNVEHQNSDRFFSIVQQLFLAPKLWWQASTVRDLPVIKVDVKFQELQKIEKMRQEALKRGILLDDDHQTMVPALITINHGQPMMARIRLKGDVIHHYQNEKFSLRIKLANENEAFGLKQFSLESPMTRDCIGPLLVDATLREMQTDIIKPRYFFVHYYLNGDDRGIMAIEEHFTPELTAYFQRPASVILKFDEESFWLFNKNVVVNNVYSAYLTAFEKNSINESTQLQRDYQAAIGLFRGYLAKNVTYDQAFNADAMASFVVTGDLWGNLHGMQWNNIRMYYNPITAKLEPIPYDFDLLQDKFPAGTIPSNFSTNTFTLFYDIFLRDPDFKKAYQRMLKKITAVINSDRLTQKMLAVQNLGLQKIGSEFYMFRPKKFTFFKKQLACLTDPNTCPNNTVSSIFPAQDLQQMVTQALRFAILNVYITRDADLEYLEIQNLVPKDVEIVKIYGVTFTDENVELPFIIKPIYPLIIKSGMLLSLPESHYFYFAKKIPNNIKEIRVIAHALVSPTEVKANGEPPYLSIPAKPWVAPLTQALIPEADLTQLLQDNPFLHVDLTNKAINVDSGTWQIKSDLIVPSGFTLNINKNTTLQFGSGHMLIAHGALHFSGTEVEPINLVSQDQRGWSGLVALEIPQASIFEHVIIKNTRGISHGLWQINSSVTFYKSAVTINKLQFVDNTAAQTLTVIPSSYLNNKSIIKEDVK
jgi:hypothetical protein